VDHVGLVPSQRDPLIIWFNEPPAASPVVDDLTHLTTPTATELINTQLQSLIQTSQSDNFMFLCTSLDVPFSQPSYRNSILSTLLHYFTQFFFLYSTKPDTQRLYNLLTSKNDNLMQLREDQILDFPRPPYTLKETLNPPTT